MSLDKIQEIVIGALRQCMPPPLRTRSISVDDLLASDLGVDSLGLMTFAMLVEDALQLPMAQHATAIFQAETVGAVAVLLDSLVSMAAEDV